jgi:hypothetical protein
MEKCPTSESNDLILHLIKKFPAYMKIEIASNYPLVPNTRPDSKPTISSLHDAIHLSEHQSYN